MFAERNVSELALRVCEGLGGSRALTVAILVRYREWDQLASLSCAPGQYDSAEAFFLAYQATSLLKKCEDLPTSFDRKAAAVASFWDGEACCFRTNERLGPYLSPNQADADPRIREFFLLVRETIRSWIGSSPPPDIQVEGRFGPGATATDRGAKTTVAHKMSGNPSLTSSARRYLPFWARTRWGSACAARRKVPVFVNGNRFATVPKDATKYRGICSEPSINVFYQLGYGSQLRARLRRATGIDLDRAQEEHRAVARTASNDGRLCTLDLKNASDSVATQLVRLCLPRRWYEALASLRSPFTTIEGRRVMLEKFSSMGNGYTFELETILFLAISQAALKLGGCPSELKADVYAFGDDLIVPSSGVDCVIAALKFCGMSINTAKSFVDGYFRESCGGDYYSGYAVRPYFLKKSPHEPQEYIVVANSLRQVGERLTQFGSGRSVHRAWLFALDQLPTWVRDCRGPSDLGDVVIHDAETYWSVRIKSSIRYVRSYKPADHRKVEYQAFHPSVVLACATYGTDGGGAKGNEGFLTPRNSVIGYRVGWTAYS